MVCMEMTCGLCHCATTVSYAWLANGDHSSAQSPAQVSIVECVTLILECFSVHTYIHMHTYLHKYILTHVDSI